MPYIFFHRKGPLSNNKDDLCSQESMSAKPF
jgi:hypothetical protein